MIVRLLPILGITFIDIVGFSILIPLMPYYVKHFGAPDVVVGLLFSTFAVCQLIAGPIWGNVSDRIGRKAVLMISQVGATIGWAMLAFANTIPLVFLARIVEGISGGNISVTQAYVADMVEPKQRARAFAWVGAAFSAGLVLGPVAGGWLFARYGYTAPFLAAAALQLVTLIVTFVALPESRTAPKEDEVKPTAAAILRSLADERVSHVLWQKLAISFGLYGWFPVFALVLALQLHFNESGASYFFACFGVFSIVYQLAVVGRLTDRLGDRRTSNIGITAVLVALCIVPFEHDLLRAGIMLAVFAFGLAMNNATMAALLTDAAPASQRGTILGVGSSLESLAGVIMPPVSTGALGLYGVAGPVIVCEVFVTIALMLGIAALFRRPVSAIGETVAEEAV